MIAQGMSMLLMLAMPLLGYLAYRAKALDLKGSLAAIFLGYGIVILGGYVPFFALLTFLILGTIATKLKWKEKKALGVNEDSCRSIGNVLGNGLSPLLFVMLEALVKRDWGWAGVFSAIATANADTLASEIGKVFGRNPILITNFRRAKVGESGAVSSVGELVALVGSFLIALISTLVSDNKVPMLFSVTLAGFIGANVDSLVGATLEKKGYVDNNGTNFIATFVGGIIGILIFLLLE